MKKETYNHIADSVLSAMITFCNTNNHEFYRTGKFSAYIKISKPDEDIIDSLKEYLSNEAGISMKKINKVIDFLMTKKRVYILFKMQVQAY